jgi:hypothetical protein
MRSVLLIVLVVMLMAPAIAAGQSRLVLELQVNDSAYNVYESSGHSYVAAYLAGVLVGLAGGAGTTSLVAGPGYHVLGFDQQLGDRVFLGFSQGDWQAIESRIEDIESGDFLDHVSPTFGFGLGTWHPLKVAMSYSGIDIDGAVGLSKGVYKLVIENKGQSGGRPVVDIRGTGG